MVNTIVPNIKLTISSSAILAEIQEDGFINVYNLCEILDCDIAILRSQLKELEEQGLVRADNTGDNYQKVNSDLDAELTRLERKVERGFYEKGKALKEIRDRALFQSRGYSSFKAYYEERFGYKKTQCYNFIDASKVYDNLAPFCETLPTCESQCRPLFNEDRELQVKIWRQAYNDAGGKVPSAKQVKRALRDLKRKNVNLWKVGNIVKITHCEDEGFRKGRIAIVTEIIRLSIKVKDFEDENILLRFDDVEETEWTDVEEVEELFEDLKAISKSSEEAIVKLNINYFAKLNKEALTEKEKFVLEMLKMGDVEICTGKGDE